MGLFQSAPTGRAIPEERASACVSIFAHVCHFAVPNNHGEDEMILERPVRGLNFSRGEPDHQTPISLRYKFSGVWE